MWFLETEDYPIGGIMKSKAEVTRLHTSPDARAQATYTFVDSRLERDWRPGQSMVLDFDRIERICDIDMDVDVANIIADKYQTLGWTVEVKVFWIFKRIVFS